jgi:uncharacterized protein (DUF885 family)
MRMPIRTDAHRNIGHAGALADHEIEAGVDRYLAWPARARSPRPEFDLPAFHGAVLSAGPVPLPVPNAHIDRFIASDAGLPAPRRSTATAVHPDHTGAVWAQRHELRPCL